MCLYRFFLGLFFLLLAVSTASFAQRDSDKDGIKDKKDLCPHQVEDVDGFQDEDGCPDPDNDGDGILDVNDRCPDQPEDLDRFMDADGCPDYDNDEDGIADSDDRCPNEKGLAEFRGCSEEAAAHLDVERADILKQYAIDQARKKAEEEEKARKKKEQEEWERERARLNAQYESQKNIDPTDYAEQARINHCNALCNGANLINLIGKNWQTDPMSMEMRSRCGYVLLEDTKGDRPWPIWRNSGKWIEIGVHNGTVVEVTSTKFSPIIGKLFGEMTEADIQKDYGFDIRSSALTASFKYKAEQALVLVQNDKKRGRISYYYNSVVSE